MSSNLQSRFYTLTKNKWNQYTYSPETFLQAHNQGYIKTIENITNYLIELQNNISENNNRINNNIKYDKNYSKYYLDYLDLLNNAITKLRNFQKLLNYNLSSSDIKKINHECNNVSFYNTLYNELIKIENNFNLFNDKSFNDIKKEYDSFKPSIEENIKLHTDITNKLKMDSINKFTKINNEYKSIQLWPFTIKNAFKLLEEKYFLYIKNLHHYYHLIIIRKKLLNIKNIKKNLIH